MAQCLISKSQRHLVHSKTKGNLIQKWNTTRWHCLCKKKKHLSRSSLRYRYLGQSNWKSSSWTHSEKTLTETDLVFKWSEREPLALIANTLKKRVAAKYLKEITSDSSKYTSLCGVFYFKLDIHNIRFHLFHLLFSSSFSTFNTTRSPLKGKCSGASCLSLALPSLPRFEGVDECHSFFPKQ